MGKPRGLAEVRSRVAYASVAQRYTRAQQSRGVGRGWFWCILFVGETRAGSTAAKEGQVDCIHRCRIGTSAWKKKIAESMAARVVAVVASVARGAGRYRLLRTLASSPASVGGSGEDEDVTDAELLKAAQLARIRVEGPQEEQRLLKGLREMLHIFESAKDVDVTGVEPLWSVVEEQTALEDKSSSQVEEEETAGGAIARDRLLKLSATADDEYYYAPRP